MQQILIDEVEVKASMVLKARDGLIGVEASLDKKESGCLLMKIEMHLPKHDFFVSSLSEEPVRFGKVLFDQRGNFQFWLIPKSFEEKHDKPSETGLISLYEEDPKWHKIVKKFPETTATVETLIQMLLQKNILSQDDVRAISSGVTERDIVLFNCEVGSLPDYLKKTEMTLTDFENFEKDYPSL